MARFAKRTGWGVERSVEGVLRELQAGLCLSGMHRDIRGSTDTQLLLTIIWPDAHAIKRSAKLSMPLRIYYRGS